jgi:methylated-DNA-[protein]-cysteine S-methyltransferase
MNMDIGDQKGSVNAALPSEDSDPDPSGGDPDLSALAAHLSATAPYAAVDPTFRETLRTELVIALEELRCSFLETPVGRLYLAYSGEVLRLVSEGDKGKFLARVQHMLGEEPVWESAPPVLVTRLILSAIRGQGPYVGPLDLSHLTPFQHAVLHLVRQIPRGEVRTCDWVAHEIGYPQAVRNVCTTLANNPFPFVIPSHRVVHSNGALYGSTEMDVETKERILAYEGVNLLHLEAYLTVRTSDHGPHYKPPRTWRTLRVAWKRLAEEGLVVIKKALFSIVIILKVLASIGQRVNPSLFPRPGLSSVGDRTVILSRRSMLDLERMLAAYEADVHARTSDASHVKWAVIQIKLGNAYRKSARGEQGANLKRAAACYEAALHVCTRDAFPGRHRFVQMCRAEVEAQQRNWANVHAAYLSARAAEELLFNLSSSAAYRSNLLEEGRDLAVRDGFALARLGWLEAAAVVIERGQTLWLNALMAQEITALDHVRNAMLNARYKHARQAYITTEALLSASLPRNLEEGERRQIVLERTEAHRAARKLLKEIVTKTRTAFPGDILDAKTIEHAAQCGGVGHALVYLTATQWGGVAVSALNAHSDLDTRVRFATLELPTLTDSLMHDLCETRLDDGTRRITGGFLYARRGDGFDLVLHGWEGRTVRERAEALHAACVMAGHAGTLDRAMQRVLANPTHACLADQAIEKLAATDRALFKSDLEHVFFQLELERCLKILANVALRPLSAWLREQGAMSLSLIPCGVLATFPLSTMPLVSECTLSDVLATSVVPTAQSLLREELTGMDRSGAYTIGSPQPAHNCSVWCEREARTLAQLASSLGMPTKFRVLRQPICTDLLQAAYDGHIVYISCQRASDSVLRFHSVLDGAGEEQLAPADPLKRGVDLRGPRLLILSACQATVFDGHEVPNEARSLTAELVLLGARAVLAPLWPVDRKAAYFLLTRFAQEWFPRMGYESPARALARAQHWLRMVTNRDLQKWYAASAPILTVEEQYGAEFRTLECCSWSRRMRNDVDARRGGAELRGSTQHGEYQIASATHKMESQQEDPDGRPYMHPVYWAGFQIAGW